MLKALMDGVGLVAAATVAMAAYRLCSIRQADARTARRAISLVLAVALLFHAGVLLSAMDSFRRDVTDVALLVEEAKMDMLKMEEIIQGIQKQSHDLMDKIKSLSYNRATSPDDIENTELIATVKDADIFQPSKENVHTGEIMEEAPKVNHEAASPPSQAEAMGAHKEKPWRVFFIPSDHVFVLDCLDDELIVRIMPPSDKESMLAGVQGCSCRKQQAAGMVPFLHTLFLMSPPGNKQRVLPYYTLFMSPPGKERVVPVPFPRKEILEKATAATLRTEELLFEEMTEVVPESFTLSPSVVAFYYKAEGGKTAMLIAATDSVGQSEVVEVDGASMVVTPLTPPGILPISFPDLP